MIEAAAFIEGIFKSSLSKLAANVLSAAGSSLIGAIGRFEDRYGEHLRQSYERCSRVRTILNRDTSVDLLSIYVNLNLVIGHDEVIDDYDFIDRMEEHKNSIISGTGGGGKTVFMRYLWISLFNNPRGRVPLFIELRKFSEYKTKSFVNFIYDSCFNKSHDDGIAEFLEELDCGKFALILDGFDEIVEDRREQAEGEILRLSRENPDSIFIVSGRPDERFNGWQSFNKFRVSPLSKKQVLKLIDKLDYDKIIKKKFKQRVKKYLYDKHDDFLSSPLLATMMLLTFDQFADVPEKIHLFYDQAFDTLFAKHDATKEAYKRKSFTGLPIDIFKKILSYICLISYYEEKYQFSEADILSYIRKGIKLSETKVSATNFLRDLNESVCLMQKDGLLYVFNHRSFQEYFSAYCLSNFVPDRMSEICPRITSRVSDKVLDMLFDMNQNLMEANYIKSEIEKLADNLYKNDSDLVKTYLEYFECIILADAISDDMVEVFPFSESHDWQTMFVMLRLYKKVKSPGNYEESYRHDGALAHFLPEIMVERAKLFSFFIENINPQIENSWFESINITKSDHILSLDVVKKFSLADQIIYEIESINSIKSAISKRSAKQKKTIDQIFGI